MVEGGAPRGRSPRREGPVLLAVTAGAVAAVAWLVSLRGAVDIDTWLHLRVGAELRAGTRFGLPDPLTALADVPYVPSQWLGQVVGSLAHDVGGVAALHVLRALCLAVLAVGTHLACRTATTPVAAAWTTLGAVLATSAGWGERPQLAGLALGAVSLWLWMRGRRDDRAPWLVVPLTWVWAMVHGSWVVGPATGAVVLLAVVVERRRVPWRSVAALTASVVVAGLTPLGPRLLLEPFAVGAAARAGVAEWQHPTPGNPLLLLVLALVVAALVLTARHRRAPVAPVLLGAAAVALSVWSVRTIAFGALLAAAALAVALGDPDARRAGTRPAERLAGALLVVGLLLAPGMVWAAPSSGPLSAALDADLDRLPAGTRASVDPWVVGWVEGAHPRVVPLRDLRVEVYSPAVAARDEAFLHARGDWAGYAREQRVDVVLAAAGGELDRALRGDAGWRTAAHDDGHVMWVRRGSASDTAVGAAE